MKTEKHLEARNLRSKGLSVKVIAKTLGVSKSSVSVWVRDISLTLEQISNLKKVKSKAGEKGREAARDKHRTSRIQRWGNFHQEAEKEWPFFSLNPIFMFGLALYIGEGGKTEPNIAIISNADSSVLQKALGFFRLLGVPDSKFRAMIHLQDQIFQIKAEDFWERKLGIPRNQFYRTRITISCASKQKGRILPNGTLHLYVGDTRIRQKIERWMQLALQ
ncbi:MAG: hypothetical protein WC824_15235 [Bacteroidota bacterium]|jgi:hypothetical protein